MDQVPVLIGSAVEQARDQFKTFDETGEFGAWGGRHRKFTPASGVKTPLPHNAMTCLGALCGKNSHRLRQDIISLLGGDGNPCLKRNVM